MVHALEVIHSILIKGGILIDIHPYPKPISTFYIEDGNEIYLGEFEQSDYCMEYQQADQAIETALRRGLFVSQPRNHFRFHTYADSLEEFADYISEEWEDTTLPDQIQIKARKLMNQSKGTGRLVIKEQISITRLQVNSTRRR